MPDALSLGSVFPLHDLAPPEDRPQDDPRERLAQEWEVGNQNCEGAKSDPPSDHQESLDPGPPRRNDAVQVALPHIPLQNPGEGRLLGRSFLLPLLGFDRLPLGRLLAPPDTRVVGDVLGVVRERVVDGELGPLIPSHRHWLVPPRIC